METRVRTVYSGILALPDPAQYVADALVGQQTADRDHDEGGDRDVHRAPGGLLEQALVEPRRRAKSRVNRVGKEQRIKSKKARGTVKATRGKVEW